MSLTCYNLFITKNFNIDPDSNGSLKQNYKVFFLKP